jgi:hypothetical protein
MDRPRSTLGARLRGVIRFVCLVGVAALVSASTASAATITRHANTKSYALTLNVGPLEMMYTPAQVKAKHPTSGEVMVGNSMGGSSMSMGSGNRHLEVHIRSRATGKVVTGVVPTIRLHDKTVMSSMAMTVKVPAAAMQGVDQGGSDLHYGNNVKLTAGDVYEVVVTVKHEAATFTFRA